MDHHTFHGFVDELYKIAELNDREKFLHRKTLEKEKAFLQQEREGVLPQNSRAHQDNMERLQQFKDKRDGKRTSIDPWALEMRPKPTGSDAKASKLRDAQHKKRMYRIDNPETWGHDGIGEDAGPLSESHTFPKGLRPFEIGSVRVIPAGAILGAGIGAGMGALSGALKSYTPSQQRRIEESRNPVNIFAMHHPVVGRSLLGAVSAAPIFALPENPVLGAGLSIGSLLGIGAVSNSIARKRLAEEKRQKAAT